MKKWYAVQKDTSDAWDYGATDYHTAKKMAQEIVEEYGEAIIAIIENDVCVAEEKITK